jgi:acyl-CoA reductase-like NAD-dependent aldehyde dehydrogenase
MSAFTVLNPATEEPVASVPGTSVEEADEAVVRAAAARPAWRAVAPGDRGRLLRRFAAAIDSDLETGNLSVNSHSSVRYWTPFGGFKQSGLGRELGPGALDAFTETKNVFIATED